MKERIKNIIYLAVILLLAFPIWTMAAGTYEVVIGGSSISGIESRNISLWDLKNFRGGSLPDFLNDAKGMTKEEITDRLGAPAEFKGNAPDFKVVANLPAGDYIALDEVRTRDGKFFTSIFNFTVRERLDIVPKWSLEENPGRVVLKKVDEEGNPLKGVGFRLLFHMDNPLGGHGELTAVPLNSARTSYEPNGIPYDLFTDDSGKIMVDNLPPGRYIFREIRSLRGYTVDTADTVFTILSGSTTDLSVVNRRDGGGFNFKKVSTDGTGLQGAVFALKVKNEDGSFKSYRVDGKDVILTSDEKGLFSVRGLPDGEYYLWEVSAPKGYKLLSEPVKFQVDEGSSELLLEIENERGYVPPKPGEETTGGTLTPVKRDLPKTGDVAFFIMATAGLILFLMGKYFLRYED